MGYYIDPPDMTKEEFLSKNGKLITRQEFMEFKQFTSHELPVCLIANSMFTAAAIAYSPGERDEFGDPLDVRPKKFYLVSTDNLSPYYKRG